MMASGKKRLRRGWFGLGAMILTGALVLPSARAADSAKNTRATAQAEKAVTLDDLKSRLETEGLTGTMHGANHREGTYVFTWTNPKDFFNNFQISLIPENRQVVRALSELERHQTVTIRGHFAPEIGPQPHIRVTELIPGARWSPGIEAGPAHVDDRDVRRALRGKKSIHAMVHAVGESGGLLVVEWEHGVLPVIVPEDAALRQTVATLYRGDKVDLRIVLQQRPGEPVHVVLNPETSGGNQPVTVTERLETLNGKMETVEGNLVLFPKSPVIRRTIYGVERRNADGLHWYFTIYNFDDAADEAKIDTLLQTAWDREKRGVVNGRNKYIHTRVRVRVTGKVNNPSPNQANPTLVTDSAHVAIVLSPGE